MKALIISKYCQITPSHILVNGEKDLIFEQNSNFDLCSLALYKHLQLDYPKFYKMDNPSKLAYLASEILLKNYELNTLYDSCDVSLVFYSKTGSLDTDLKFQETIQDHTAFFPSPSLFVYTLANIPLGEICIRHKFMGENYSFLTEEKNNKGFLQTVQLLFDNDETKACILVWNNYENSENYEASMLLIETEENFYQRENVKKHLDYQAGIGLL